MKNSESGGQYAERVLYCYTSTAETLVKYKCLVVQLIQTIWPYTRSKLVQWDKKNFFLHGIKWIERHANGMNWITFTIWDWLYFAIRWLLDYSNQLDQLKRFRFLLAGEVIDRLAIKHACQMLMVLGIEGCTRGSSRTSEWALAIYIYDRILSSFSGIRMNWSLFDAIRNDTSPKISHELDFDIFQTYHPMPQKSHSPHRISEQPIILLSEIRTQFIIRIIFIQFQLSWGWRKSYHF